MNINIESQINNENKEKNNSKTGINEILEENEINCLKKYISEEQIKEILTNYFAREGFMQGGEYINFAVDVENGEISSYEWDVQTDGDYEDSYETYASYSFDYELENFKFIPPIIP